jgi:chromosome segregation ATPase
MAIDKKDPYPDLPRGGNMARRIVATGAGQNLGANMNEGNKVVGQRQLDEALAEVSRLKGELAVANTRIMRLEGDFQILTDKRSRRNEQFVEVRNALTAANTKIVELEKERDNLVGEMEAVYSELRGAKDALKASEMRAAGRLAAAKARPWEDMGISKATYYNRKKEGKL